MRSFCSPNQTTKSEFGTGKNFVMEKYSRSWEGKTIATRIGIETAAFATGQLDRVTI